MGASNSHQNKAQDLLPSLKLNVDKDVATTSDLAASQQLRKRTSASIDKNQEDVQTDVNTNVANGDDVPVKKKRKVEAKPRAQPRPKKRSSTGGRMDMPLFCQNDIVMSTPKPNPDQNMPNIPYEIVEEPSVQINDDGGWSIVFHADWSGKVQVAEDHIVINDSNTRDIRVIAVPAMSKNTKRKATKRKATKRRATKSNNKPKRLQQKKTKDPEKVIPTEVCNEKQISPSTIHLRDCPVCLDKSIICSLGDEIFCPDCLTESPQEEFPITTCPVCFDALKDKSTSFTNCGHIFCTDCITKILMCQEECPICRSRLTKTKIHPLFLF